jgi:predicted transposase/invertase (TIGR01784 family)
MALAPLNRGVIFKKLFTDPDILKAFAKDLLDIELDPQIIETEKKFFPAIGPIDIGIDVFVEDPKHRIVLEIQRVWYDYHYDRFLYYHNAAIIELQRGHEKYKLDHTVYTIIFCSFTLNNKDEQKGMIVTTLHSQAEDGEILPLYPHKLIFLNSNYNNENIPAGVKDWLELMDESIKHPANPQINVNRIIIQKAADMIQGDKLTPTQLAKLKDETEYEGYASRKMEEGRKEGRMETARKMLAKGFSYAEISELTGLSPDELAQL